MGMSEGEAPQLSLSPPAWAAMLQRGVGIPHDAVTTVREFLQECLGIDPGYVEERLQTVFVDGRPVDDLDRSSVGPGRVLALSGAMPGLAGATMRRGGYYARLREDITHPGTPTLNQEEDGGFVVLKLFNRPLADLAELMTARPLLVPGHALKGWGLERGEIHGREVFAGQWVRVVVTLT